jgi:rare lipoprotein A
MKKNLLTFFVLFVVCVSVTYAQELELFQQEGIASWYGAEFDGRPTASGEIFDASQLTAAHPSLPFGTMLVITNRHNDKKVTVRVNDRGPFVAARIIDVSRAAAEQLDMIVTGTAPVLVESVDRVAVSRPAPVQAAPAQTAPIQVVSTQSSPVQTAPVQAAPPVLYAEPPVIQPIENTAVTNSVPVPASYQAPVNVYVQPQPVPQTSYQFKLSTEINIDNNKT